MTPPIDSIRLSQEDRDRLIRVKRLTGIESWNVLCRWALLLGLRAERGDTDESRETRGAIEIKWDTFAGSYSRLLAHLITWSYQAQKTEKYKTIGEFIHGRLTHGILILSKPGKIQNVASLPKLVDGYR